MPRSGPSMPTDDTLIDAPEFRGEYELDLERWFRRRFGWLCIAYAVFTAVSLVVLFVTVVVAALLGEFGGGSTPPVGSGPAVAVQIGPATGLAGVAEQALAEEAADASARAFRLEREEALHPRLFAIGSLAATLQLAVVLLFHRIVRPRIETRESALEAATRMILALGAINLLSDLATRLAVPEVPTAPIGSLAGLHFFACLFLPWTPRESLRPLVPLLVALALFRLLTAFVVEGGSPLFALGEAIASPLVLAPGMAICWWRLRRHRRLLGRAFVGREFRSLRQEMKQARTIHEATFPQPFDDGRVRFDFAYAPARDLGGDYLHLSERPSGTLFLAIVDVTGHGLAAAMTVNRIAGELERIHAERPDAGPGEVLEALNRYVHLTLARHSVLATAAAIELDPSSGLARVANAGHPPIYVRSPSGAIEAIEATEPLLGALPADEFGRGERRIVLEPGTVLLLYTDGAFEARNRTGAELGLDGLQALLRHHPPPRRWPRFMLSMIDGFEGSVHADDVLVASLSWLGPDEPNARAPFTATAGAPA
jgi:hypothetical protein